MEEKIFDANFFARLNTLKMSIKLKLDVGMSGGRKSTAKGSSVEFSDFREYLLGDDIRRIDWNAYGRMDKLFVKLFMEEKEGIFYILIDCSKSMDYGKEKKSIFAQRIAGMLSYIVLNNLDRVYVNLIRQDECFSLKGMTGKQSFSRILNELERIIFEGDVDLNERIQRIPFSKKGVTIIISDFFVDGGMEPAFRYLKYKKQDVVLIHTLAKEEIDPESEGNINYIDSENSENMNISISSDVMSVYQKTLMEFRYSLKEMAKKYQMNYIPVVTSDTMERFIYEGIQTGQWS